MRKRDTKVRRSAVHEAGHIVAAYVIAGVIPKRVVSSSDGLSGATEFIDTDLNGLSPEDYATIVMAGSVAVALCTEGRNAVHSPTDVAKVNQSIPPERLGEIADRAAGIVQSMWGELSAISDVLDREGKISPSEIGQILRGKK